MGVIGDPQEVQAVCFLESGMRLAASLFDNLEQLPIIRQSAQ